MANRKRSPQRARGRSTLEKSFRDAQAVLSGYIESGGKQVKDTMTSLLHIFDMDKTARPARSPRAPRRAAAKTAFARPARHAASRSAAATRRSKRPAKTRSSARSAKRAPRI